MVRVAVGPVQEVSGFSQFSAVEPDEFAGIAVGKDRAVALAAIVGSPMAVGSDESTVSAGRGVDEGMDESPVDWGMGVRVASGV